MFLVPVGLDGGDPVRAPVIIGGELPRLVSVPLASTAVTALAAPVASGTADFPVPISRIVLSVTLKRVLPRLISWLSRS